MTCTGEAAADWSSLRDYDQDEILDIFRDTGVLLEGHFLLTSGQHSPRFLQCAQVLRFPHWAREFTGLMTKPFRDMDIDKVVGPALGGIILSYESARWLGSEALFTEKDGSRMRMRRGFSCEPTDRVLIVEDAVSTGGSVRATLEVVEQSDAEIVGVSTLVDRSGGQVDFGVPFHSVVTLDVPAYPPSDCPMCEKDLPLIHPKDLGM